MKNKKAGWRKNIGRGEDVQPPLNSLPLEDVVKSRSKSGGQSNYKQRRVRDVGGKARRNS